MMIRIEVPGDPKPAQRPRFSRGRVYTTKQNAEYRAKVLAAAQKAMAEVGEVKPSESEMQAMVRIYRKYKPTSKIFGDVDNFLKNAFDSLNGVAFKDDSQVTKCFCEKHTDRENPRLEIFLADIDTEDNVSRG